MGHFTHTKYKKNFVFEGDSLFNLLESNKFELFLDIINPSLRKVVLRI